MPTRRRRVCLSVDMSSIKNIFSREKKKEHPKFDELTINQGGLAPRSTEGKEGPKYGLQLLYDGANAGHRDIDFVAVHGMGGHPLQSFTNAETGCCWIRDLLPLSFPHSRVFSYGYPADFLTKINTSLSDQARELCWALRIYNREQATTRRRILICHSVGGLLVKRVLIEATHHPQFIDVYKYTSGIVFLGTPHRGSSTASLALTLAKIVRVDPGALRVNQDLLRELQRNSSQLDEINQEFAHVPGVESLSIGSIYETRVTKHIGIIAERSSAILGFPSELCISLDVNHAQLSKFEGSDDDNYQIVLHLLLRFRKSALLADEPFGRAFEQISCLLFGFTVSGVSVTMDSMCCFQKGNNINGPVGNGWVYGTTQRLHKRRNGHHRCPRSSRLTSTIVDQ